MKTTGGREALQRLLRTADVFVQNYRPGAFEALGLGYQQVSATNPRLIYCAISAFGSDGPKREETGYDTDSGRRTRLGFLCGREAGRLVRHESRRQAMARVAGHLSVEDLEAGFRSARDPTAARHFQVIWLLARGHTIADVAAVTSFVPRWIEQLLARYNAHGPEALGDLRRRNGGVPRVLRPALLERLRARLEAPPPDGGLWSSRKVAAWMAGELGLAAVLPQRGWEALKAIDWSVQKPRPRHPAAATPEEREAFKKSWSRPSLRRELSTRTSRSRSGPPTSTASG